QGGAGCVVLPRLEAIGSIAQVNDRWEISTIASASSLAAGPDCNQNAARFHPPSPLPTREVPMRNPSTTAVVSMLLCWLAVASAAAADPSGNWLTKDGEAKVAIARCTGTGAAPGTLCGAIVALKEPNDPATGRPKTDHNNPDSARRGQPMIGVQIVFDLKPSGTADKWNGQ